MATSDTDRIVLNKLSHFGCLLRIVLLGEHGVGCKTLMKHFTTNSSTSILYRDCEVAIDGINVKILLFHWRNLSEGRSLMTLESWGKMLHGAVLVFDVTNPISLGGIGKYLAKLSHLSSCAKVIIGNKMDLLSNPMSPILLEGKEIAIKNALPFFLTSALTGENVEQVLITLAAEALVCVGKRVLPPLYMQEPTGSPDAHNLPDKSDSVTEETRKNGDYTILLHENREETQSNCCKYS